MTACSFEESIEELALGNLDEDDAARARAHLEGCAACRAAHAQLERERMLFVRRAEVLALPPPPPIDVAPRRAPFARIHAFAAAIACAAAVLLLVTRSHGVDAAPSAEAYAARDPAATSGSFDEPLACAFPASGFVFRGEGEPLACRNVTFSSAGP